MYVFAIVLFIELQGQVLELLLMESWNTAKILSEKNDAVDCYLFLLEWLEVVAYVVRNTEAYQRKSLWKLKFNKMLTTLTKLYM